MYHARGEVIPPSGSGESRSPRAQKFTWKEDGYPDFGMPLPTSAKLPKPSGTKFNKE